MNSVTPQELYNWCKIPYTELEDHSKVKIPFRLCDDSKTMGKIMARELVDEIKSLRER